MNNAKNLTIYIDPPSHHFLRDQLFNVKEGRLNGDNILAPYAYLRDFFTSKGIPVHTADYLSKEAGKGQKIYISLGRLENYRKISSRQDTILSAFFVLEAPIVEPSLYRELKQVRNYFKRIFSWSDYHSIERFIGENLSLQLQSFRLPQSFDNVHEDIWKNESRKFLIMINANKLPRVYWQELYTERLRAIEYFSRTGEIDLYGVGWDGPSYQLGKSILPATIRRIQRYLKHQWQRLRPDPLLSAARRVFRGPAISKSETLGKYTFALCFENMILKGWITEKIFDCFFAGTIPIYWGAPDINDYIPGNCFIDQRKFLNFEELRTFLRSLGKKEITQYKENARNYLASDKFRSFNKESFIEIFKKIVEEDTGIRL